MNEFIWTTRTGKEIPLSKIGNVHLFNIERMIRRQFDCTLEHDHDIICAELRRRELIPEIWQEQNE